MVTEMQLCMRRHRLLLDGAGLFNISWNKTTQKENCMLRHGVMPGAVDQSSTAIAQCILVVTCCS
ncbi:hypothetical protein OESDEN_24284 [Oesophagostomum dentatum]|uniref:Uncharacterized protein n=1 Tax=Oesophagostomum dentatum TaxID=61180 RepID=A0A0B1RY23_OESDE|nr:hypothetical protein OESDEN_24284 [Oesophagostomum dentatum]